MRPFDDGRAPLRERLGSCQLSLAPTAPSPSSSRSDLADAGSEVRMVRSRPRPRTPSREHLSAPAIRRWTVSSPRSIPHAARSIPVVVPSRSVEPRGRRPVRRRHQVRERGEGRWRGLIPQICRGRGVTWPLRLHYAWKRRPKARATTAPPALGATSRWSSKVSRPRRRAGPRGRLAGRDRAGDRARARTHSTSLPSTSTTPPSRKLSASHASAPPSHPRSLRTGKSTDHSAR